MIEPVPNSRIHCTIRAARESLIREIGKIAQYCAIDLKMKTPLSIKADMGEATHITLSVDVESALSQQVIWRLASRVASFCPHARVSTQILSLEQFQNLSDA
ncbi:hypothetical protein QEH53_04540 [Pelagicoccus sp. SDUM812002]|nr:hypothetical protein [Pelagicoccus sp. SDUM812002]